MKKPKPLPNYGDLITVEKFLSSVQTGSLISYDGYGHWATKDMMDSDTDVWNDEHPPWATHVMWFNK